MPGQWPVWAQPSLQAEWPSAPPEMALVLRAQAYVWENEGDPEALSKLPRYIHEDAGLCRPDPSDLEPPSHGWPEGLTAEHLPEVLLYDRSGLPLWWVKGGGSQDSFRRAFRQQLKELENMSPQDYQRQQSSDPERGLTLAYQALWNMYLDCLSRNGRVPEDL